MSRLPHMSGFHLYCGNWNVWLRTENGTARKYIYECKMVFWSRILWNVNWSGNIISHVNSPPFQPKKRPTNTIPLFSLLSNMTKWKTGQFIASEITHSTLPMKRNKQHTDEFAEVCKMHNNIDWLCESKSNRRDEWKYRITDFLNWKRLI